MSIIENEQKFLDFYDQNATKIYRYVYFRVGSEEVAEDLSSEAFMKVWRYLKSGKDIGNISAVIYEVCRNIIADFFRNKKKLQISLEEVAEITSDISESGFVRQTEANLQLDKIKHAIRLLKDEYQELIIWYYIDDLKAEEIAQITGKSEGAVRTSLSRALKALRRVLEA